MLMLPAHPISPYNTLASDMSLYSMVHQQQYGYGTAPPPPPPRQFSGHGTSSAFSSSANADEDWTKISDLAERRRIQNRIAQRNYRMLPSASDPRERARTNTCCRKETQATHGGPRKTSRRRGYGYHGETDISTQAHQALPLISKGQDCKPSQAIKAEPIPISSSPRERAHVHDFTIQRQPREVSDAPRLLLCHLPSSRGAHLCHRILVSSANHAHDDVGRAVSSLLPRSCSWQSTSHGSLRRRGLQEGVRPWGRQHELYALWIRSQRRRGAPSLRAERTSRESFRRAHRQPWVANRLGADPSPLALVRTLDQLFRVQQLPLSRHPSFHARVSRHGAPPMIKVQGAY